MQWRTEPVHVEKCLDELWIGVKGQSNPVIAGSLRNSFRASLAKLVCGGRATDCSRALTGVPRTIKLRIPQTVPQESDHGG